MLLKLLMGIGIGSWLALPVVSRADTLNFTLSEPNNTYTWSLPSNPAPPSVILGKEFASNSRYEGQCKSDQEWKRGSRHLLRNSLFSHRVTASNGRNKVKAVPQ